MTEASIVIPAYKEKRLKKTVEELENCLKNIDYEIIIVTDHPSDPTTKAAKKLTGRKVKHISLTKPVGKGGAVIEGFLKSKGKITGFIDADGSVPPKDVKRLINQAEKGFGAIASRRHPASQTQDQRSIARKTASKAFNILVKTLFNIPFKDTQCGAKFFPRKQLIPVTKTMKTTGFEFDVELLWKLRKKNLKIKEIPVTWKHFNQSNFNLTQGPKMVLNLLKIRLTE